ncbi:MAG: phosphatase PAP2 family protein [Pseudomonadota bacterium]
MSAADGAGNNLMNDNSRLRQIADNARGTLATLTRAPRPASRKIAWPPAGRIAFWAALAVAAIAAAMLLLDPPLLGLEQRLPYGFVQAFEYITDLGLSGWFLWPTGILLLAMGMTDSPDMPRIMRGVMASIAVRLGFVFTAIAVPGLFVAIVKRLIGRERPWVGNHDIWTYRPFGWQVDYASFPSGHSSTAFSAAVAIGAIWPAARPYMWLYAVVIACSRVIVSAHHPSDVVAGAIVGGLGALLVRNWFAARRLGFWVGSDGCVRRLPGPSWRRAKAVARGLFAA